MEVSMKKSRLIKTVLVSVAGLLVSVIMLGCPGGSGTSPAVDGSVTVRLENASAINGHDLYAYLYAHNEYSINTESKVLAVNYETVASGTSEITLEEESSADDDWAPNGTTWMGSGGVSYDVYIYTDDNDDGDHEPATGDPGSSYRTDPYATTVTIDGDQTITVNAANMIEYTGGTLTVSINEGGPGDPVLTAAVFANGADPDTDDPLATGWVSVPSGGGSKNFNLEYDDVTMGDGDDFYGVDGISYNLYVFLDKDSSQDPSSGDKLNIPWPTTYMQSGDETEATTYPDDYDDY
jgi:hypothetical protein